jgi:hypothetical protein
MPNGTYTVALVIFASLGKPMLYRLVNRSGNSLHGSDPSVDSNRPIAHPDCVCDERNPAVREFSELTDEEWMRVAALLREFNRKLHRYARVTTCAPYLSRVVGTLYRLALEIDPVFFISPSCDLPGQVCRVVPVWRNA